MPLYDDNYKRVAKYYNIRCRKCGSIISFKKAINPLISDKAGYLITSKDKDIMHPGCNIEDGESVYADLISFSENPLSDAVLVVDLTKKEEVE